MNKLNLLHQEEIDIWIAKEIIEKAGVKVEAEVKKKGRLRAVNPPKVVEDRPSTEEVVEEACSPEMVFKPLPPPMGVNLSGELEPLFPPITESATTGEIFAKEYKAVWMPKKDSWLKAMYYDSGVRIGASIGFLVGAIFSFGVIKLFG